MPWITSCRQITKTFEIGHEITEAREPMTTCMPEGSFEIDLFTVAVPPDPLKFEVDGSELLTPVLRVDR